MLVALGGLLAVLAGLKISSSALRRGNSHNLRTWLMKGTRRPLYGVFWGACATALVQSSSLAVICVIGLVDAGLLELEAAVTLIMGANIGTTITAQLVAFRPPLVALALVGVCGGVAWLCGRRLRVRLAGSVLVGFALIYWGLDVMGAALAPLADAPWFRDWLMAAAGRPWLAVMVGVVLTSLAFSSSLTIGLLQQLAGAGLLPVATALPVLFGDNIGTTTDTLLASVASGWAGRRAALFHLAFNVLGTLLFMACLPLVAALVTSLAESPARQIAHAHTLFNVANTLVQLPFRRALLRLLARLTPA